MPQRKSILFMSPEGQLFPCKNVSSAAMFMSWLTEKITGREMNCSIEYVKQKLYSDKGKFVDGILSGWSLIGFKSQREMYFYMFDKLNIRQSVHFD